MTVVSAANLAAHLNLPSPTATADAAILDGMVQAAQAFIEASVGYRLAERYDEDPVPEPLKIAVLQLAAHWYTHREAVVAGDRVSVIPFGVEFICTTWRDWTF
jgi:hypothetical protein